jgi:hypothetical protein
MTNAQDFMIADSILIQFIDCFVPRNDGLEALGIAVRFEEVRQEK